MTNTASGIRMNTMAIDHSRVGKPHIARLPWNLAPCGNGT